VDVNGLQLSADLLRALRGRRSQNALSKRAGYRSNMVSRWERGACWPTAARFFELCELLKIDVARCYATFFRRSPAWLGQHAPASKQAVAAFLNDLRGKTPILELARVSGYNRYSIARWLRAQAEPKLPEFLRMIEVSSRRQLDFVATLVDPARLPSAAKAWALLESAREVAYGQPWAHAVLRALELDLRSAHGAGQSASIAAKIGLPQADVEKALALLHRTGHIRRRRQRYEAVQLAKVDTRQDPERALGLKTAWARVAFERLSHGTPGTFGYSLFAVSKADLRTLQALHLEYVRAMQSLIAKSHPADCVGLYCVQLLDLEPGAHNALIE
jgi:hypothetical protein